MWRDRSMGPAVAVLALISCSKSANQQSVAAPSEVMPADVAAQAKSQDIVVSGSRVRRDALYESLPPAPPPPPPPAPGMYPTWSPAYHDVGRDKFSHVDENPFKTVQEAPVSTFSIDVDTASYSWVRASLSQNVLPQPAAVRTEEMVNYFPYDYAPPRTTAQPFSNNVAVLPSPWSPGRKLVRIGIKGYSINQRDAAARQPRLPDRHFGIDAGAQQAAAGEAVARAAARRAGAERHGRDRHLRRICGHRARADAASDKQKIRAVIDQLGAGGSTAGAEGIRQAYALAEANLDPNGVNRVILATDGDFNVGITDQDELKGYIEREREKGVFLSVLGFGMGNYNDALMQTLAQNGNGAAAYIDTLSEARKTLVDEASSTLFPIAKDVKIQVEFNPATVAEYRLIGYETRALNRDDFDNDKVDAGDVGSGQTRDRALRDHAGRRAADDERPALLGSGEGGAERRQRVWLPQDPLQAAQVEHQPADLDANRSRP